MKYKKRLGYPNIFLNIILVVMAVPFIGVLLLPFNKNINRVTMGVISQIIIGLLFYAGHVVIVLTLKKILKSIGNRDPFNTKNIIYFDKIGNYVFIVGVIYAIISYPGLTNANIQIMATSYGSLKPMFFLYIILGGLSFILSDIFKMGKEIKDENDLMV